MTTEGQAESAQEMATPPTATTQDVTADTAASAPPDDPQELREEIERTREQLGETVQALAAKADVKARAQDKAAQVTGRMKTKARHARQQAAANVGQVQSQLADESAAPRQKVASMSGPAYQQAALAAAKISTVTPEPVQRAAHKAAATARQHRVPLAAGIGAGVLAWLVIGWWRRR